jgi:hypothetical protein
MSVVQSLDSNIAAAMLGALPDANWLVEKAILKEKSNIAPVPRSNSNGLVWYQEQSYPFLQSSANFTTVNNNNVHPHFGSLTAHGWHTDHDTESCYRLRDLRKDMLPMRQ